MTSAEATSQATSSAARRLHIPMALSHRSLLYRWLQNWPYYLPAQPLRSNHTFANSPGLKPSSDLLTFQGKLHSTLFHLIIFSFSQHNQHYRRRIIPQRNTDAAAGARSMLREGGGGGGGGGQQHRRGSSRSRRSSYLGNSSLPVRPPVLQAPNRPFYSPGGHIQASGRRHATSRT
jgi:hypothetical protein